MKGVLVEVCNSWPDGAGGSGVGAVSACVHQNASIGKGADYLL